MSQPLGFLLSFKLSTTSHYLINEIINDHRHLKRAVSWFRIGILNRAIKITE